MLLYFVKFKTQTNYKLNPQIYFLPLRAWTLVQQVEFVDAFLVCSYHHSSHTHVACRGP